MTLKTLMTTTALSLLLATSVTAQSGTGTQTDTGTTTTAPAESTAPTATNEGAVVPSSLSGMTVGDLNGTDVIDASGETIGTIKEVVQGPGAAEAVIGIGGFLGLGQYEVALPLNDLSYEAEAEAIAVTLTREELEAKPEYDAAGRETLPADTQLATLMEDDAPMPAADAPAGDALESDAPVTEAPAGDGTTTDAPMNNAPVTDAPATDAPATDETPQTETDTGDSTTTD